MIPNEAEFTRSRRNDSTICLLKIVRELVSRLIQLDIIRAGHHHHDDPAVSRCSIGPRNCAPFARNSSTVVSISSHINAIEC